MYGYGNSGNIGGIIIGIIIGGIILFLICRELICWYYKINKMVELLEEQNNLLRQQINLSSNNVEARNDPSSYDWVCKKCNNSNRNTALFCNSCGEKK